MPSASKDSILPPTPKYYHTKGDALRLSDLPLREGASKGNSYESIETHCKERRRFRKKVKGHGKPDAYQGRFCPSDCKKGQPWSSRLETERTQPGINMEKSVKLPEHQQDAKNQLVSAPGENPKRE